MQMPKRAANFEWNLNTILLFASIGLGLLTTGIGWGVTFRTTTATAEAQAAQIASLAKAVDDETAARYKRMEKTDANFQRLNDKMPQFDIMAQQILRLTELTAENRQQTEKTQQQFERYVATQSDKLDKLIDAVADLRGDMKAVQSQLSDRTRVPSALRMR